MRYGFVIDHRKCIGCHACTTACKSEHEVPLGVFRTWVKYVDKGPYPNTRRNFLVQRCNHCENAPCVNICPTKALYKRSDGIVDFNKDSCIGCKSCMEACPYEAIYIDPATHTAAKCNYCAHRTEVGLQPACVIVCPVQAIISGDLEDPSSEIANLVGRHEVQVRKPEKGTKPQLFYIGADQVAINPEATGSSQGYMWSMPNTRLHGREELPEPVVPSYRPLNFKNLVQTEDAPILKVETPLEETGVQPSVSNSTLPPPAGRTIIPLATVKSPGNPAPLKKIVAESPAINEAVSGPGRSVAAGLLAGGVDAQVDYNVTHEQPWGFLVALYLWTKSIAAGSFIMLALALGFGLAADTFLFNGIAPFVALLFTGITTALLVADLKRPERFLYILLRPNWTSWLVWGAYILIIYSLISGLWFLARLIGLNGLEGFLLWPGVVFGVFSAIYSAFLFGQAKGRDFWQSPLLAPHLFIQAFLAGSGVLTLLGFFTGTNSGAFNLLTTALLGGVVVNAAFIMGELFVPHLNSHISRCVNLILSGKLKVKFWLGFVLPGVVAPLVLLGICFAGGLSAQATPGFSSSLAAVAAWLALAGLLVYESIWIDAGQSVPLS